MSKRPEKSTTPNSADRNRNFDFKVFGLVSPENSGLSLASRGKCSSGKKHKLYDDRNNSFCSRSVKKLKVTHPKTKLNDVISEKVNRVGKEAAKLTVSVCHRDIVSNNDNSNPADNIISSADNSFRNWDIDDISSECEANSPVKRGPGSKIDRVLLEKFASPISVPSAFSSPAPIKVVPLVSARIPVASKNFTKQHVGAVPPPPLRTGGNLSYENQDIFVDNQFSQCPRADKLTKISEDKQIHSKNKELLNLSSYFNERSDSDDSQSTSSCDKSPLKSQNFMISDESPKKSSHCFPRTGLLNISISTSTNASQSEIDRPSLSIDFGTREYVEGDSDPLGYIQIQEDSTPVKHCSNFKRDLIDDENSGDNRLTSNSPIRFVTDDRNSHNLTPVKHSNVKINDETPESYRVSTLPSKAIEILKNNSPVVKYFNNRSNKNNNHTTPVKESTVNINDETPEKQPTGVCQPYKVIEITKMNSPVVRHLNDQFNDDSNDLTPVKETNVNINDETPEKHPPEICQPYKAIEIVKINSPAIRHLNNQFNEDCNDLTPVKETIVNINDETPEKEPTGICQPYKVIEITKMNSPVVRHLNDQFNEDSNDLTPVKETDVNINDETPVKDLDETQLVYRPIDVLKKRSSAVRCIMEKDRCDYNLTCVTKSPHNQICDKTPEKLCQFGPSLESIDGSEKSQLLISDGVLPIVESNVVNPEETPEKGIKKYAAPCSVAKLIKRNSPLYCNPGLNDDKCNRLLSACNVEVWKDRTADIITDNVNEFEIQNRSAEYSINDGSPTKQLDVEISERVTPAKHGDFSFLRQAKLESVVKLSNKEIDHLTPNNFDVTDEKPLQDIEKYKVPITINYDALAQIQNDETPQNSQEIFISDNTPVKTHRFNITDESTPTKMDLVVIDRQMPPLSIGKKEKFPLTVSKVKKKPSSITNCDGEKDDVEVNSNEDVFDEKSDDGLEYDIDAFPSPSKDASVMPCERESAVIADIPGLTPRKHQVPVDNTGSQVLYFSRKKRLLKSTTLLSKAVAAVNNLKSRRKLFSYEIQVGLRSVEGHSTSDLLQIVKTWKDHRCYYVKCRLPDPNQRSQLFPSHSFIFVLNQKPKDTSDNDLIKMYYPVQIFECPWRTDTLIGIAYYLEFIKNELSVNEPINKTDGKCFSLSMDSYLLTDIFKKSLKPDGHYVLLNSARSECIGDAFLNASLTRSISLKVKVLRSVVSDSNIYFAAVDNAKELCLFEFIYDSNIEDIWKDIVNVEPVDCFFDNMKFKGKESVLENDRIRNVFESCTDQVFGKDCWVYSLVPREDWSPGRHFKRL